MLLLMAVGPAVAAGVGALLYPLAAAVAAIAESVAFTVGLPPASHRAAQIMLLAVAGVTVAGVQTARSRRRRDRELADTRLVADVAQRALMRPVPARVGPVGLSVRYLSAASGARVGGDLYEVVATPHGSRVIIGDVEGKGLPAVASAAGVLGVFREAAYSRSSPATSCCSTPTEQPRPGTRPASSSSWPAARPCTPRPTPLRSLTGSVTR